MKIRHSNLSAKTDNATEQAAGEMVPSSWNEYHTANKSKAIVNCDAQTGIITLTQAQCQSDLLRITGKPTGPITLQIPAGTKASFYIANRLYNERGLSIIQGIHKLDIPACANGKILATGSGVYPASKFRIYTDKFPMARLLSHFDNDFTNAITGAAWTNSGVSFSSTIKKFGTHSAYFNGSSRLEYAAGNAFSKLCKHDFTIEFFIYCATAWNTMSANPGIVSAKASDGDTGYVIYRNGDFLDRMSIRISGTNDFRSNSQPTTGAWDHWCIMRKNGFIYFFKNGVLDNTPADASNLDATSSSAAPTYVGYTQTWGGYLQGAYIDELRIINGQGIYPASGFIPPDAPFDRPEFAMMGAEVQAPTAPRYDLLMRYDTLKDIRLNDGAWTPDNGQNLTLTSGYDGIGKAVSFPGTAGQAYGFYTTPLNFGYDDFTIEFRIKKQNASDAWILQARSSDGASAILSILFYQNAGRIGCSTTTSSVLSTTILNSSSWYHVAFTRKNGYLRLYINGKLEAWTATTDNVINGGYTTLGCGYWSGTWQFPLNAAIDDLIVLRGACLYEKDFTPEAQS